MNFRPTTFIASILAAAASAALAGQPLDAKTMVDKNPVPEAPYEAGRGLITLEGPSGMFINPTSATLPQGAATLQYCFLFADSDADVIGHGLMAAYGVTDWLEIGAITNLVDVNVGSDREFIVGGPLARIRLTKDEGWVPQMSVGFYGKYGTTHLEQSTAFFAAYKRITLDEEGFFKSLGVHAGVRVSWFDGEVRESGATVGYGGLELQLPARIYLVGEVSTRDNNQAGQLKRTPYAFGVQWRLGGVNTSIAMMQQGSESELGIWFGLGYGHSF